MSAPVHVPVLLKEAIEALGVQPGGRYIDGTVGTGGHARAILEKSSPGGQLLGIDADPDAIKVARIQLKEYSAPVLLVNDNFVNLQAICLKYDFYPVHGILFDLGLSSLQLEARGRGFSFQYDDPLDMRFNPEQEVTAADIVNTYSEAELADLIWKYGEERYSRQIARRIVQERPIETTLQLAQLIEKAVGGKRGKIHPATRTFQALRIAVNRELEYLESALKQAVGLLGFGGRLVVISYHSLEDRIVKRFMQRESVDCVCPAGVPICTCGHKASLKFVTKKVITPSPDEIKLNPRSRSAKLRVSERINASEQTYEFIEKMNNCSDSAETSGWGKPILLEKLRRTFLALQFASDLPDSGGSRCKE